MKTLSSCGMNYKYIKKKESRDKNQILRSHMKCVVMSVVCFLLNVYIFREGWVGVRENTLWRHSLRDRCDEWNCRFHGFLPLGGRTDLSVIITFVPWFQSPLHVTHHELPLFLQCQSKCAPLSVRRGSLPPSHSSSRLRFFLHKFHREHSFNNGVVAFFFLSPECKCVSWFGLPCWFSLVVVVFHKNTF